MSSDTRLELLIVEDSEDDVFLLRRAIRKVAPKQIEAHAVSCLKDAVAAVGRSRFDAALLDLSLPDSRGLDTFERLFRAAPDLPIVVLTGNEDEELALKALHEGAQDYMVKGHVDGQTVIRSVRYAIERHARHRLERANVELTDEVTERKRMQEELELLTTKLERSNLELQQFASVASHDLQEPLRKIIVFGGRLSDKAGAELGPQARDYLSRMTNAAERMQSLIRDLLAFSRVATRAEPFQNVNLGSVAREVVGDLEVLIEKTGARVELGELPEIEADPFQVRQLLQNLIANALKFHRRGVAPVVQLQSKPVRDNGPGHPSWEIRVSDNGIGFEEKYVDRIFSPFQRLHGRDEYEGSGMGLAICHRIVERHGGRIAVKSSPGEGSTFILSVPAEQPTDSHER